MKEMTKEKFSKVVRIITIPPILVSSLFIILYFKRVDIITSLKDLLLSILFLGIIPILAYPAASLISNIKDLRNTQRKLAFLLNILGYIMAFIYGFIVKANIDLKIIYSTYLISVLLLTFINLVLKTKASGHATSMTGPLYLLFYFKLYFFSLIFIFSYILVFISSLLLKRHTIKEFIIGTIVPLVSLIISILIFIS
jgi:hypothetical protein